MRALIITSICLSVFACQMQNRIEPKLKTTQVPHDSDDPAIWLNKNDLSKSLIIGSDKDEIDGGVYAFDLTGKRIDSLSQRNMKYPNNVDLAYDFILGEDTIDIAVSSEREANKIRLYKLPELTFIDNGGIPVFEGEKLALRRPMGVAFHKNPKTGAFEIFVSRKIGPKEGYLGHYEIYSDSTGNLQYNELRRLGKFSGGDGEIEAIAVDDEAQVVYYSDEACCIRAYSTVVGNDDQLFQFGEDKFTEDREGISIYKDGTTKKLIISNQQELAFNIYDISKAGTAELEKIVYLSTHETDGCELTTTPLPGFPNGLFVAMSDDRTFHYYDLKEVLEGNVSKQ
jgi:3-phytase